MKGYKSKITQDAIDRAHFLKNQNPKMSNDVLAATLFGEGYTPRKYSGTVVGLMLKVNTIDEYLNLPANTKKQYKKQTEIIVEQDDLDEQSESEHDETYQDQQREDSEIINDLYKVFHEEMQEETEKATETDAKDQERQQTQYEDRSDYDCFEMRVKKMAEICERFLLCKGTNGYPDESIATKTSGIAAYLACIRKSLNAFHGDYKADSQNASKAYDVIFEKLDELDENQKSIMNNQNKMVELFSESNKLLKRVVELWETPSNNAEI